MFEQKHQQRQDSPSKSGFLQLKRKLLGVLYPETVENQLVQQQTLLSADLCQAVLDSISVIEQGIVANGGLGLPGQNEQLPDEVWKRGLDKLTALEKKYFIAIVPNQPSAEAGEFKPAYRK